MNLFARSYAVTVLRSSEHYSKGNYGIKGDYGGKGNCGSKETCGKRAKRAFGGRHNSTLWGTTRGTTAVRGTMAVRETAAVRGPVASEQRERLVGGKIKPLKG